MPFIAILETNSFSASKDANLIASYLLESEITLLVVPSSFSAIGKSYSPLVEKLSLFPSLIIYFILSDTFALYEVT